MSLKGDIFENRYRLIGELISLSPTHVGTGEVREEAQTEKKKTGDKTSDEKVEISLVATDVNNKPYIPGSALRGVIRHYLRHIFIGLSNNRIAQDQNFESTEFKEKTQEEQINYMRTEASMLERLLGTPFAEGKAEFWDASAINTVNGKQFKDRGWNSERNTYVVKSVAIDPTTGTAFPHKLYTFEVAPPGLRYELNVVGQNLDDEEIGMLLFGLESFNSEIFPLTIGAMSGRGFGRMSFKLKEIYRITQDDLPDWVKNSIKDGHAGYHALKNVTDQKDILIKKFKTAFQDSLGGDHESK